MGDGSMRRRKSADGNPRVHNFKLRLSLGEKSMLLLRAKACGLSMTDYVLRRAIYDDQPIMVADTRALESLAVELARQGNNLNQAAHALNAAMAAPLSLKFLALLEDGAASVARQEAARLAAYRKLDEAVDDLMTQRITYRDL